jgi:hypothetical protein
MAVQPGSPALRLLSGPAAGMGRQLVPLHGAGNRSPTHHGGGARAPGLRRASWTTSQSDYLVLKEIFSSSKGVLIRALVSSPRA